MGDIAEILEHWHMGRGICAIFRSLEVYRATVRKYVYAADAEYFIVRVPESSQIAEVQARFEMWLIQLSLSLRRGA